MKRIDVTLTSDGIQITYVCDACSRGRRSVRHFHGVGEPPIAIGDVTHRLTHCPHDRGQQLELRLVAHVPALEAVA